MSGSSAQTWTLAVRLADAPRDADGGDGSDQTANDRERARPPIFLDSFTYFLLLDGYVTEWLLRLTASGVESFWTAASPADRKPVGVADHERERAEHLGPIAQNTCLHLERRHHTGQGVAFERLADPGDEPVAGDTEVAADDDRRRAEHVAEPGHDAADLPARVGDDPACADVAAGDQVDQVADRELARSVGRSRSRTASVDATVSRQPRFPQRQTAPSLRTSTWPSSPASPVPPR